MKIEIKSRFTGKIIVCNEYSSLREAVEKNKAYLRGAYLGDADLEGADLRGADLEGAYLRGANGYYNSHHFFAELIKRKNLKDFTNSEWAMIGQILVHRLCWDSIKKRYGKKIKRVFDVLAKDGFAEFKEKYKEVLGETK